MKEKDQTPETVNTHVCHTCKHPFKLTLLHEQWFINQGLKVPTNCLACRMERRAQRNEITSNYREGTC
jgi:hypothetical protein